VVFVVNGEWINSKELTHFIWAQGVDPVDDETDADADDSIDENHVEVSAEMGFKDDLLMPWFEWDLEFDKITGRVPDGNCQELEPSCRHQEYSPVTHHETEENPRYQPTWKCSPGIRNEKFQGIRKFQKLGSKVTGEGLYQSKMCEYHPASR